jgi:hypothetical protein
MRKSSIINEIRSLKSQFKLKKIDQARFEELQQKFQNKDTHSNYQ